MSLFRLTQLWTEFSFDNIHSYVVVSGMAVYETTYNTSSTSGIQVSGSSISSSQLNQPYSKFGTNSMSLIGLTRLWSDFSKYEYIAVVSISGSADYLVKLYESSTSGVEISGTSLASTLSNKIPIAQSGITFRYSNNSDTLTAGNSDQANPPTITTLPNVCLGGWISSSVWSGLATNDLFNNITSVNNQNLISDYRCVFVVNNDQFLTFYNAVVFLPSQAAGGANVYIAVDPTGVVPINQSDNYQAIRMDNPTLEPTYQGQSLFWTMAPTLDWALTIGDITPQSCAAIWFKRTAQNSPPLNNDGVTIRVQGDSPE